jgi:hypothetical protein
MNHEEKVLALLESMELAATCPDCGRLSMEVWMAKGSCPYCHNRPMEKEESIPNIFVSASQRYVPQPEGD